MSQGRECLRCRRPVVERRVRSDRVVATGPAFHDDLRLFQRVEDFTVEQFVTQARIKTFDKAVLPRAAWRGLARAISLAVAGLRMSRAKIDRGTWSSSSRITKPRSPAIGRRNTLKRKNSALPRRLAILLFSKVMTGRSRKYYQNIRVPQRLPSLQCAPWIALRTNSALAQTIVCAESDQAFAAQRSALADILRTMLAEPHRRNGI